MPVGWIHQCQREDYQRQTHDLFGTQRMPEEHWHDTHYSFPRENWRALTTHTSQVAKNVSGSLSNSRVEFHDVWNKLSMPVFLDQKHLGTLCEAYINASQRSLLESLCKGWEKVANRGEVGSWSFCLLLFFPALDKAKCYCSDIRTDCIMFCIKDYIIMWLAYIEIQ